MFSLACSCLACDLLQVDIDTVEKFESLRHAEQQYFIDMVQKCKDVGEQAAAVNRVFALRL